VAEAHDRARDVIAEVAADFTAKLGRPKAALLELAGDPSADTALVTIGTIGETARELLADDDAPVVVRVHAYRPFPAKELAATLAHAAHVCVVDRAPAFGAPAPLGEDVRALGIRATDVVCGLGGTDVTPDTLRLAITQARGHAQDAEALYLVESA
jgi:pyruvate ferredoxin oxidoreductase alpha subunit